MFDNWLSKNKLISILYLITLVLILYSILIFFKNIKNDILIIYYIIIFLDSFIYSKSIINGLNLDIKNNYIIPVTVSVMTEIFLTLYILFIILKNKINIFYDVLLISSLFITIYILILLMFIFGWKRYNITSNSKFEPHLTKELSVFDKNNYNLSIFITTKRTPASSIFIRKENKLNIYFNEDYIKTLNFGEIEAVVFHEIGHIKTNKIKKSELLYSLPVIIYLYLIGYLYFGSIKASYIDIIILVFMILSFFYITKKLPSIILSNEYNADKYAASFAGVNNLRGALLKIKDYYDIFIFTNANHNYMEINSRIDRIDKINLNKKCDIKNESS